jgi:hypothetical protein
MPVYTTENRRVKERESQVCQSLMDMVRDKATAEQISEYLASLENPHQERIRAWRSVSYGLIGSQIIDSIKASSRPLLSLGCGAGFLEAVLKAAGVDIIATDKAPPSDTFTQVVAMDAMTAQAIYPTFDLLISYPENRATWPLRALFGLKRGQTLYFIGEADSCASGEFYEKLSSPSYHHHVIPVPTWPGLDTHCMKITRKDLIR